MSVCVYVCARVYVCVCAQRAHLPCTYIPGSHTYMSTSRVQHCPYPVDQLNDGLQLFMCINLLLRNVLFAGLLAHLLGA